jgi:UDP-2,4-diacetamido-2,4,6-trideoxy-beta-L-altropyranose hydrolase
LILFFISSGVHIGIGHVKRSVQLALELMQQHQQVSFCLKNDPKSIEIIIKNAIEFSIISEQESFPDLISNHRDVQLVVLDLLDISGRDTQKIKDRFPHILLLALDYFDMEDSNVSTIINLINHNKTRKRPLDPAVRYLEGPAYGILRTEFQVILTKGLTPKKNLRNILVTFGGSDPRLHTLSIIQLLQPIVKAMNTTVTVIIGPNFVHQTQVIELLKPLEQFSYIVDPPAMATLMSAADLCICGSGTTILELSALGTPALIVPQSKEELNFSTYFETAGCAHMIGTPEGVDSLKLKNIILSYYDNPLLLTAMSLIGPKICDGKGKERVVEEILNLQKNSACQNQTPSF